jgi:hypothetical protein
VYTLDRKGKKGRKKKRNTTPKHARMMMQGKLGRVQKADELLPSVLVGCNNNRTGGTTVIQVWVKVYCND